jgi:hypothetical protein
MKISASILVKLFLYFGIFVASFTNLAEAQILPARGVVNFCNERFSHNTDSRCMKEACEVAKMEATKYCSQAYNAKSKVIGEPIVSYYGRPGYLDIWHKYDTRAVCDLYFECY